METALLSLLPNVRIDAGISKPFTSLNIRHRGSRPLVKLDHLFPRLALAWDPSPTDREIRRLQRNFGSAGSADWQPASPCRDQRLDQNLGSGVATRRKLVWQQAFNVIKIVQRNPQVQRKWSAGCTHTHHDACATTTGSSTPCADSGRRTRKPEAANPPQEPSGPCRAKRLGRSNGTGDPCSTHTAEPESQA